MKLPVIILLSFLLVSQPSGRVKRMKEYPFPAYEYSFNKPVIFMFPMMKTNTIGVYYGYEEQEKIASLLLQEKELKKEVFKVDGFDGYMTAVYPQVDPEILVIAQKSSIGVLNLTKGNQIIDYRPKMPNYDIRNEYFGGKVFDGGMVVKSLAFPFIQPDNEAFYSYSLILEDIQNSNVLKRIRINEESYETIFLGQKYTYFLDCSSDGKTITYNWRAVDDMLEYSDHPLLPILDEQWKIFRSDAVLVSESQKCAIAYGALRIDTTGTRFFQITPWVDDRPPIKIILPGSLMTSPYILKKNFLLSPSGKWLFFTAAENRGDDRCFLTYIDKNLPTYYAPPIEIDTDGDDFEVTWMKEPEGFVLHTGKILRYWDLSKFDPTVFSKGLKK
jgi:hypothetical protein